MKIGLLIYEMLIKFWFASLQSIWNLHVTWVVWSSNKVLKLSLHILHSGVWLCRFQFLVLVIVYTYIFILCEFYKSVKLSFHVMDRSVFWICWFKGLSLVFWCFFLQLFNIFLQSIETKVLQLLKLLFYILKRRGCIL